MTNLGLFVVLNAQVAKQFDVVAIGHALVDVLTPVDESFLHNHGLTRGAMLMIDEVRADFLYGVMSGALGGGDADGGVAGAVKQVPGGSGASTAAGTVSCGGTAAFIGTLSDDTLGRVFTDDLKNVGVHDGTYQVSAAGTGRSLIVVEPGGERTMNTFLGAASHVEVLRQHGDLLASAKIVFIEGYLFDSKFTVADVNALGAQIRESGGKLAITLSDSFCVERHRDEMMAVLEDGIDICLSNQSEIKALFQTEDLDAAVASLTDLVEVVAVTRSAEGSIVASGNERIDIPAQQVEVVDATGAGDLYAAGFLFGLSQGWDLARSGRMGTAAASAVLGHLGNRVDAPISESSVL